MQKHISVILTIALLLSSNLIIVPVSSEDTITITSGNLSININTISEEIFQKKDEKTRSDENSTFEATGFYYVKEADGVWWFINKTGHKFYSVSVGGVVPSHFFYGNVSAWVNMTRGRLDEWGFNTMTGLNETYHEFNMPYIARVSLKHLVGGHGWVHTRIPDVFDPEWKENVSKNIVGTTSLFRNDSNLLGYQTDNEMKWGPDTGDNLTLLEVYMAAPAETPGKQELVRFFSEERYDNNTDEFNRIWNMDITDFNDLKNYTEFGIEEAWRIQSRSWPVIRKLKNKYPHLQENPELFMKAKKDIKSFSTLVAETYFNTTNSVLKAADPNHLNLGVRFHLLGVPEEVLRVCGRYVDVISINYYRKNILIYDPVMRFYARQYDCVPLDNWMSRYHDITGKPLFVSEYNFKCNDGSWPIIKSISPSKVSRTQKGRAYLYEWYNRNCLKNPYLVGQHWFLYRDAIDINYGMVDLWDNPFTPLVNRAAKINHKAIEIHENASHVKNEINKPRGTSFLLGRASLNSNFYLKILDTLFTVNRDAPYFNDYSILNFQAENADHSCCSKIINNIDCSEIICVKDDSTSNGNTLYVGGNGTGNYSKIQDAIDNASDDDTIYVYNGTYSEKIIINKSITLIGENKEITVISGIYESSGDIVIIIEADYVNITGFNITNEGGFIDSSGNIRACSGIYLYNYSNCNISDNIFYKPGGWGGGWGLMSLKSDNNMISNNVFYGQKGCGIIMDGSNNTIVQDNIFVDNGMYGIWMSSCKDNTIKHNIISQSNFGITMVRAHGNTILENSIQKNKLKGICLKSSNNNNIIQNNFIKEKTLTKKDIVGRIQDIYYKFNYRSAAFFNSTDNSWDGNYWNGPYLLPKIIFGKTGQDNLVTVVNFDWNPAKKPYDIPRVAI